MPAQARFAPACRPWWAVAIGIAAGAVALPCVAPCSAAPRLRDASTAISTTGRTPTSIARLERRLTGWSEALGETVTLLPAVRADAQNGVTAAHGVKFGADGPRQIFTGSDGRAYMVIPRGVLAETGDHLGRDPHRTRFTRAIIARDQSHDIAVLVSPGSTVHRAYREFTRLIMREDEIAELKVDQEAYFAAFPLYGDFLPQPATGPGPTSPFGRAPSGRRERQSFGARLMNIGRVDTNRNTGVAALAMSTPSTIKDGARPIGGASGAAIWVRHKHRDRLAALADAVSITKDALDPGGPALRGQEKTAVIYGAYQPPPDPFRRLPKHSARLSDVVTFVSSTGDIPGYVSPEEAAELRARSQAKRAGVEKIIINGDTQVYPIGWIHNAVVFPDLTNGYVTVAWADPGDPEGDDLRLKVFEASDFVLDALPGPGNDRVSLDVYTGALDRDHYDADLRGFSPTRDASSTESLVVGQLLTGYADYSKDAFKVFISRPSPINANGVVSVVPSVYFGAQRSSR